MHNLGHFYKMWVVKRKPATKIPIPNNIYLILILIIILSAPTTIVLSFKF